ncbi:VacJ family lipoprotein [Marinobacter sp.]|uniref:MlaA family lipoprotein n=1 Tax=Marinobacter sp. TaxID=50741 RepID=UPI001A0A4BC7|nr:VacJ family lipoprotein [Marinobacter sp.]MBE0487124.1 VacJ family lipoprotein [Marinobacter sp.]
MNKLLSRCRSLLATPLLLALTLGSAEVYAQNVEEPQPDYAQPASASDPYESWNRKVFSFNDAVDRWFLRPVAQTYRTVTPDIVDRGVTNFFSNLTELRNFTNSLLQLKGESAVVAAGRFTYNTVFGLGGIFDVATAFDLPERPEDFGQTLGYWGVGSGPYLVLPFLGPATPRYFTGMGTDGFLLPSAWDQVSSPETYYLRGLQLIDMRAGLIPAEQFISGDRYTFVRNAFLQRREFLINDGKITEDPFADEDDFMFDDF